MLHTPVLSDKAFRRLYTVSRRNAMERNRRRPRLCPPGKAPIQAMAGALMGAGGQPSLHGKFGWPPGGFAYFARVQSRSSVRRRTKFSLAGSPARLCAAGTIACGWDFISCPMPQRVSLSSTTCLMAGIPPPSAEGGKMKSRAKNRKDQNTSIPFSQEQGISDACVLAHVHSI